MSGITSPPGRSNGSVDAAGLVVGVCDLLGLDAPVSDPDQNRRLAKLFDDAAGLVRHLGERSASGRPA